MAMTNAERQKKYRQARLVQSTELDLLRNENDRLTDVIRALEIDLYHLKENYDKSKSIAQDYSEIIRVYRHHLRHLNQETSVRELKLLYPGI